MVRHRLRSIVVGVALLLSACAGSSVIGEVRHPAELPVRAFAPIAVTHLGDPESIVLGGALVERLADGGTPAELRAALEPTSSGVRLRIDVTVSFRRRVETRWSTRPENVCGPYGCYVRQVSYPYESIVLVAEAGLTIRDVSAGRVLAERRLVREDRAGDSSARRSVLLRQLVDAVAALVDPRLERLRVRFARVRVPGVESARAAAEQGAWETARVALEGVRADPSFASLDPSDRARVLYDLALAWRFGDDVRARPVPALEQALAFVRDARRLDDEPTYRALEEALVVQLEEARLLERQETAVSERSVVIPVPEAYGDGVD